MQIFRCCFRGDVTGLSSGCATFSTDGTVLRTHPADDSTADRVPVPYDVAFEDQVIASGSSSGHGDEEATGACQSAQHHATIAVDATSVDAPCITLPARWSDYGTRPELEDFFLQSPFVATNNQGSFSKPGVLPDSVNLESTTSLGGQSSDFLSLLPAARQPQRELRCTTFAQLMCTTSSACWVGQGAQGAVVKAQWRAGCTVAVKWLVTDAVNIPAAYMEALVAKMLAHPFLVQTFECGMCQLDETFDQLSVRAGYSPWVSQAAPKEQLADAINAHQLKIEPMSVVAALDSFEGPHPQMGPRPVDCVEVLKQLGAAPGKYVVQIVSEWCDEGTLHAAIRNGVFRPHGNRSKTWALRALLRTAREIAQGLCHLHSFNIIHGDLKPGNVLLKSSRVDSRGFVAKVADFGLSRLCRQHDAYVATAEWGTVPYMAGEYLDNKLYKSSDVYSFGVLLWQMYTGKAPFEGHHEAHVAVGVMMGNLQLEWPASMPPPLLRLGQACCRHEPDQRPTFKECVVALVGLEAQVREMAARLKARSTHMAAAQRCMASMGPSTTPPVCVSYNSAGAATAAAVGAAASAVPRFANMRCSSLEPAAVAASGCGSVDACPMVQSFTHCGYYLPGCSGLQQRQQQQPVEDGSIAYSQWQSQSQQSALNQGDAGGLAAACACAALAMLSLPDGPVCGSSLPSVSSGAAALTRILSEHERGPPAGGNTAAVAAVVGPGWPPAAAVAAAPPAYPAGAPVGEFWYGFTRPVAGPSGGPFHASLQGAGLADPGLAAAAWRPWGSAGAAPDLGPTSTAASTTASASSHCAFSGRAQPPAGATTSTVWDPTSASSPSPTAASASEGRGGLHPAAALAPSLRMWSSGGHSAEWGPSTRSNNLCVLVPMTGGGSAAAPAAGTYGASGPSGSSLSPRSAASNSSGGGSSNLRTVGSGGPPLPPHVLLSPTATNTNTSGAAYGSGMWALCRGPQGSQVVLGPPAAAGGGSQMRAMSARRGSTGRVLQHVPEDEGDGSGMAAESDGPPSAAAGSGGPSVRRSSADEEQSTNP